jgi:hypothetical protein
MHCTSEDDRLIVELPLHSDLCWIKSVRCRFEPERRRRSLSRQHRVRVKAQSTRACTSLSGLVVAPSTPAVAVAFTTRASNGFPAPFLSCTTYLTATVPAGMPSASGSPCDGMNRATDVTVNASLLTGVPLSQCCHFGLRACGYSWALRQGRPLPPGVPRASVTHPEPISSSPLTITPSVKTLMGSPRRLSRIL